MIDKTLKKLNISYARYLKNRLADKHIDPYETSKAERNSRRVKFLKRLSFKIVLLLIVLIIVWPLTIKNMKGEKLNFSSEDKNEKKEITENIKEEIPVMLKPRFFGNDDNGQPYNISADSGASVSENKVVLTNISGEMMLQDESKIEVSSKFGDYYIKTSEVSLSGSVKINFDKGYDFETNTAYIKFKENMATGSEKVKITGPIGNIISNGFTIRNSGDEMFFFGGVKLESDPNKVRNYEE